MPNIEVNIAPLEETTERKLVADATVSAIPGIVRKKAELKIEGGQAKEITGGRKALRLKEILERTNDPNSYIVTEIGVGLNPQAKVRAVTVEDEASLGSAHVALDNHRMGGRNTASAHIDMVIQKVTIELEGNVVSKVNKLLV